jgi:hypothetical protein
MVTLRGIVFFSVLALVLLGACRDVPVDESSARVIPKDGDSTHTPPLDSCPDCVTGHKRSSVRLMTVHYKYRDYKGYSRWDSISINLLDTTQKEDPVCTIQVEPRPDGGMKIKLHIEAGIPFLGFAADHEYYGVRHVVLNIPEIIVDGKGKCNPIDLRSDPMENDDTAGINLPYRYNYSGYYGQVYDVIRVATGDRNRGSFRISGVDPRGRFIDARLEASFHFPDTAFVYQHVPSSTPPPNGSWKKQKVEAVDLSLSFRLALNP